MEVNNVTTVKKTGHTEDTCWDLNPQSPDFLKIQKPTLKLGLLYSEKEPRILSNSRIMTCLLFEGKHKPG